MMMARNKYEVVLADGRTIIAYAHGYDITDGTLSMGINREVMGKWGSFLIASYSKGEWKSVHEVTNGRHTIDETGDVSIPKKTLIQ